MTRGPLPLSDAATRHAELLLAPSASPELTARFEELYNQVAPPGLVPLCRQITEAHRPQRASILVPLIERALRATEREQCEALLAGSRLGHPALAPLAIRLFETSTERVQLVAAQALGELGDRRAHLFLSDYGADHPELDSSLRVAIKRALDAIEARHPAALSEARGGLSLSTAASTGSLSLSSDELQDQDEDQKLKEASKVQTLKDLEGQLEHRVEQLLLGSSVELVKAPRAPVSRSPSAPRRPVIERSPEAKARDAAAQSIVLNEQRPWRLTSALLLLSGAASLAIASLPTELFTARALIALLFTIPLMTLLPYLLSSYGNKTASTATRFIFRDGQQSEAKLLKLFPETRFVRLEVLGPDGQPHVIESPISPSLTEALSHDPTAPLHLAWHPDEQRAHVIQGRPYLDVDERGLARVTRRRALWALLGSGSVSAICLITALSLLQSRVETPLGLTIGEMFLAAPILFFGALMLAMQFQFDLIGNYSDSK